MNALTILTALLALLQSAGVIGSFTATILTSLGVDTEAVTVLKTVCSTIAQSSQVTTAVKALASQIEEWCDGDTSYSIEDLIAQCKTIESQSETIQALS